jgi:hypothetical protein
MPRWLVGLLWTIGVLVILIGICLVIVMDVSLG